ncbi:MAG: hypothetical protein ACON5B_17200 [Myxococcota bacterium]
MSDVTPRRVTRSPSAAAPRPADALDGATLQGGTVAARVAALEASGGERAVSGPSIARQNSIDNLLGRGLVSRGMQKWGNKNRGRARRGTSGQPVAPVAPVAPAAAAGGGGATTVAPAATAGGGGTTTVAPAAGGAAGGGTPSAAGAGRRGARRFRAAGRAVMMGRAPLLGELAASNAQVARDQQGAVSRNFGDLQQNIRASGGVEIAEAAGAITDLRQEIESPGDFRNRAGRDETGQWEGDLGIVNAVGAGVASALSAGVAARGIYKYARNKQDANFKTGGSDEATLLQDVGTATTGGLQIAFNAGAAATTGVAAYGAGGATAAVGFAHDLYKLTKAIGGKNELAGMMKQDGVSAQEMEALKHLDEVESLRAYRAGGDAVGNAALATSGFLLMSGVGAVPALAIAAAVGVIKLANWGKDNHVQDNANIAENAISALDLKLNNPSAAEQDANKEKLSKEKLSNRLEEVSAALAAALQNIEIPKDAYKEAVTAHKAAVSELKSRESTLKYEQGNGVLGKTASFFGNIGRGASWLYKAVSAGKEQANADSAAAATQREAKVTAAQEAVDEQKTEVAAKAKVMDEKAEKYTRLKNELKRLEGEKRSLELMIAAQGQEWDGIGKLPSYLWNNANWYSQRKTGYSNDKGAWLENLESRAKKGKRTKAARALSTANTLYGSTQGKKALSLIGVSESDLTRWEAAANERYSAERVPDSAKRGRMIKADVLNEIMKRMG